MSKTPKGNEPLMIVARLLFGLCGIYIALKYLSQLPSGVVMLVLGENDLPNLSYTYRASTPEALLAAAIGFGGLSLGFIAFALFPKVAFRPDWVIPWAVVSAGALFLLKHLAQFSGIISA